MNKIIFKYIYFLSLAAICCIINPFTMHADTEKEIVSFSMEILDNAEKDWTIENILSPGISAKFIKPEDEIPFFPAFEHVLWIRMMVKNAMPYKINRIIQYNETRIGKSIAVYTITKNKDIRNGKPVFQKIYAVNHPAFFIEVGPEDVLPVYIRIHSNRITIVDFKLRELHEYIEQEFTGHLVTGIYLGIMILAIVYNLFIFFSFKDYSFLFYIIFIISFGIHEFFNFGFSILFYPWLAGIDKYIYENIFTLAGISGLFFAVSFLSLKTQFFKLDKYLKILLIPFIFFGIAKSIIINQLFVYMYYSLFFIISVGVYILGIIRWATGYKPARLFTSAIAVLLFSTIFQLLPYFNIIKPMGFISQHSTDIGGVLMIILFSFAIPDKIKLIQKEKTIAQYHAIENLRKADKLKDEFLAKTSHELKTPLNGIIGIIDSLIDDSNEKLSQGVKNNLLLAKHSGLRLNSLISDLLDYSMLIKNEITLHRKAVSVKAIVEDVCTLLRVPVKKKNITLGNHIADSGLLVYADENRLYEIFYNLIGNALKFTEKGTIKITAARHDADIVVSISDTGIGIPDDKIESIFNPFEQVDNTISRQYGGTGLGLSIVKNLIELHDGKIWVESKLGSGTTFYITLPNVIEEIKTIEYFGEEKTITGMEKDKRYYGGNDNDLVIQPKKPLLSKYEILVVEDEPVNIQLLINYLSLHDFNVHYACSSQTALQRILEKQITYDAILLDVMMPKISGFEVCRRIREKFSPSQLPIIFLTVKNSPTDIAEGLEAGANDYLTKPLSKKELIARLYTHLEITKLTREIEETQKEIIFRVGTIAETRSRETGNHIRRVTGYSILLAEKLQLNKNELYLLQYASPMHDIGKVAIPDTILNKQGTLTPEEFEIMKKHTVLGYEMIGHSDKKLLRAAGEISLTHHERWDGDGYPRNLKGENIPIFGRITTVADVFDALGSDRCYKKAWPNDQVLDYLKNQRGKQFDPILIDIFFNNLDKFMEIRDMHKDE